MTKEVFEQKSWKDSFTKDTRPVFTDLEAFIDNEVYCLFRSFAEYILQEYNLRFGIPVWNAKKGWTYRIGKIYAASMEKKIWSEWRRMVFVVMVVEKNLSA